MLKEHLSFKEFELVKVDLIRGLNNRFFFVTKEKSSETYFVYCIFLRFRVRENQWNVLTQQVYISTTGSIIAVVKDQDYPKEIDSYWTYSNEIRIHRE